MRIVARKVWVVPVHVSVQNICSLDHRVWLTGSWSEFIDLVNYSQHFIWCILRLMDVFARLYRILSVWHPILSVKVRMRRRCILCILAFVIVCIVWLRLLLEKSDFILPSTTNKFDNFDNVTGAQEIIVPNVIHFILFGQNSLEFISFLSILSALKVLYLWTASYVKSVRGC